MAVQECLQMLHNKQPMKVWYESRLYTTPSAQSLQKIICSYMPGKQELKRKVYMKQNLRQR